MEKAPKDTEAISEPILEEEPSAEKYLFDATILRGKESYDAFTVNISDKSKESLPDYDSLHIKQKLLFSHLRPEASKFSEVSLSRQVAAVDAHGLSIEDMSFDFDPDLRKEIHRAVLSEVVGDAKDSEEAAERLAGANATFREYLRQRAEANVRSEIQRTFTEKSAALRKEITDRYEKTTLTTLRRNYIESIKPDYDKEAVDTLTKRTAEWESGRRGRDESLYEGCRKIDKALLDKEGYRSTDKAIEGMRSINSAFRRNDMLFVRYKTMEQLAKRLNADIYDPIVSQSMHRITNPKEFISEKEEIYNIAQSYAEAKRKIDEKKYFDEYVRKSDDFSYLKLYEILQKKEKAAFLEYSRLFTDLTPEEAEKVFGQDFAGELSQKKKAYVMKRAGFNAEEYKSLTGGRVSRIDFRIGAGQMANQLAESCYSKGKEEMPERQKSNLAYATRVLHYAVVVKMAKNFDMAKFNAPKEIQRNVFDRCLKNDLNYIRDESYRPDTQKIVSSSVKSGLGLEEAKAQVISILAPKDDEELAEYTKYVEESIENVKKRIEDSAKYYDASARFGTTLCTDDKDEYQTRLDALKKEKEALLEKLPEDKVATEYGKEMQEFSHRIFNDEIDEVFILPTGFVVRHNDGDYQAISVDTASDEIAQRLDKGWDIFWRSYLRSDEYNNPAYKKRIIKTVNDRIEADLVDNIEFADKETQVVYERCKESGIEVPGTLESQSGSFAEQLTETDCDNFEHCREKFGRYFDVTTTVANGTYEPHESALESSVRDYVSTGSTIGAEAIAKFSSEEGIILKRYSALAEKLGQDVADSYIINNISSSVFTKNEKNLIPILKNILGDEINISVVTAMRLTGKKITSAENRQKVAMRALFAANYNRYIRGEEIKDAKLAELIRRVDELEFGKVES